MELKHLRKGKISNIKTEDLSRELDKLEARQAKYESDINDNLTRCNMLFERLVENGESTNTHRHTLFRDDKRSEPIIWSEDKEEWYELDNIICSAKHSLKKMQKKKKLIEEEMIDRTLTGSNEVKF